MLNSHRIVAESHPPGGTYKADAAGKVVKIKERSELEAEERAAAEKARPARRPFAADKSSAQE